MKPKWDVQKLENEYQIVHDEEFKQILDEYLEVIYRNLCQPEKDQSLDPNFAQEILERKTGS